MPTNGISLLLFVALLLPGLAYTLVRERHRPTRSLSAFRETAQVAFVSVVADLLTFTAFLTIRSLAPGLTPDPSPLLTDPERQLNVSFNRWFFCGLLLLSIATVGAAIAGTSKARDLIHKALPLPDQDSSSSAWWTLFSAHPGSRIYVGLQLDDGRWIEGFLYSWAREAEDVVDRELTLSGEVKVRPAHSKRDPVPIPGYGSVAVSARRIQYMAVSYVTSAEAAGSKPGAPHTA